MSWTYSGDPSTSTRDTTRFLLQDTDSSSQQLSDEELDWLISGNGSNAYRAAIAACEILVSKYSGKADRSVGDLSISYSQLVNNYRKLMATLRSRAALSVFTPYAGGISISDKQTQEEDSDRMPGSFRVGMHDYDGTLTEQVDEND